jgi:hypothetical protein
VSGKRFDGEYQDGLPNGNGTYTRGRSIFSGYWSNGCFKQGERKAWVNTTKEACGF